MKILIALSDKYFAEGILRFMQSRPWPDNTVVRVVHVLEPEIAVEKSKEIKLKASDPHCAQQVKLLEDFAFELKKAASNLSIEKALYTGSPEDAILDNDNIWEPDLIVMGSHGRCGIEKLMVGSVSQSVTAKSSASVVIVKAPDSVSTCDKLEDRYASRAV